MLRRWTIISIVVLALGVIAIVIGSIAGSGGADTHLAPVNSTAGFLHQGNALCRPLTALSHPGQFSQRQLTIVRTEIEEIGRLSVPPSLHGSVNALLGVLSQYASTFAHALGQRHPIEPTNLGNLRVTANHMFAGVGLHSCHI